MAFLTHLTIFLDNPCLHCYPIVEEELCEMWEEENTCFGSYSLQNCSTTPGQSPGDKYEPCKPKGTLHFNLEINDLSDQNTR